MATISIQLDQKIAKIKPMHAGGQPPLGGKDLIEYFHYMTEAGIPYSRLHDVGGNYGGARFVDVPNIFRDFDADEKDPASYDFTFTDHLIRALVDANVEPYFRLGITIENHAYIKPYRTRPPKDYEKWARVCAQIVRHYTEGWADGFFYKITYWEIWNEPDNIDRRGREPQMWSGTKEEFYRLYDVTAKHLKAHFPHLKVGGYASCGFYPLTSSEESLARHPEYNYFIDFYLGFLRYVKAHGTPLDFFSWHSYQDTRTTLVWERYVHDTLIEEGFEGVEIHLNEWDPFYMEYGTAHHSAEVAAMMLAMQDRSPNVLCIYDMRTDRAPYCPLFDIRTHKPIHAYYALFAFNRLYRLGDQVALTSDTEGLYAVAATDGTRHAMMISNVTGRTQELQLEGVDTAHATYHVIDQERLLSLTPPTKVLAPNDVLLIEW